MMLSHPNAIDFAPPAESISNRLTQLESSISAALSLGDNDLAEVLVNIDEHVENRIARLTAELAHDRMLRKAIADELQRRIIASGGRALPSAEYEIVLEQKTELRKDIAGLRALKTLLSDDEFGAAVYERVVEPEWVADARKLGTYARKYGGAIAEIVTKCVRHVEIGAPRLKVERREKRVLQAVDEVAR